MNELILELSTKWWVKDLGNNRISIMVSFEKQLTDIENNYSSIVLVKVFNRLLIDDEFTSVGLFEYK